MVRLLNQINVPDFHTWRATQQQQPQQPPPQQQYNGKPLPSAPLRFSQPCLAFNLS